VLGSATPALESYANAQGGKYELVTLPRRIADRPLPVVEVVDLREHGPAERVLSAPLRAALGEALSAGRQALLLLNRRGFAAFLQCHDCGSTWRCPNCRITLTLHRPRGRGAAALRCHYCDHSEAVPDACPACRGRDLGGQGLGTQQVEEAVTALFPAARIARMDLDTTSRKGSHRRLVEAMERGEMDVLVGTQMVAKGHDFPGLTLVGVVSGDTGLNLPDFRAAERTFQLVTQVAGRPGRGTEPGRVLVQTYAPEHPAIRAAALHDYLGFYAAELEARFEASYPPAVKLASCLLSGSDEQRVSRAAASLAEDVGEVIARRGLEDRLSLLGPSEAPLAHLRGRSRWQVLLKSASPAVLERVLRRLATRWKPPRGVQLVIDRDPYSLM
jgi:primosomal protein N' (replication factor Y)